jgi:hypothetical protein
VARSSVPTTRVSVSMRLPAPSGSTRKAIAALPKPGWANAMKSSRLRIVRSGWFPDRLQKRPTAPAPCPATCAGTTPTEPTAPSEPHPSPASHKLWGHTPRRLNDLVGRCLQGTPGGAGQGRQGSNLRPSVLETASARIRSSDRQLVPLPIPLPIPLPTSQRWACARESPSGRRQDCSRRGFRRAHRLDLRVREARG